MKRAAGILLLVVLLVGAGGQSPGPSMLGVGFSMRPGFPHVGDMVRFKDYSTGNPISWLWEFGDGGSSTLQNPTHVYNTAGTFELSLTITDAQGNTASYRGYLTQ